MLDIASGQSLEQRPTRASSTSAFFDADEHLLGVRLITTPLESKAQGIDVSRFTPHVSWADAKAGGITFGFAKATEGTERVDATFQQHWAAMKEAGMIRGAYHAFRPAQDAKEQAVHFAQTVQLEADDLPPVLDVELDDGLGGRELTEAVRAWLSEVERLTGRRPIIYAAR